MKLHNKKAWLAVGLLMACAGVFAAEERTAELRLDAEELYPMNIGDGKYDVLPVDGMPVDENPPFLFCSPEVPNRTGYEYVFRLSQDPEMKAGVIQGTPRRWSFYSPYQVLTKGVWYWQYGYRQVGEGSYKFSKTYSFRIADEARDNRVPPFRVLTESLDKSPLPRVICKAEEVGKLWPQDAEFRAQVEKSMKDKAKIPIKLPEIAADSKSKILLGKKGDKVPDLVPPEFLRTASPYMAAYALTKDPVYIPEMKKAVDFILTNRKFNPIAGFFDEMPNPVCFYYELLHDQLPADEREKIRKILCDALFGAVDCRINGLERYTLNEHDWQSDVPCMVYMAAVLYDKQVPASVEALEYLYDLWNFRGPVGERNSGDWASFGYFQTHVKELFRVPFFFSRYTGYNYFNELPWYRNVGKRYAYFALPGSNEIWGDGGSEIHKLVEILNLYFPDRYRQLSWNTDGNPIEARKVIEMSLNDWFALPALTKAPLPNRKNPAVPIQPLTEKGVLFRDTGLVVLCTKPSDPEHNVKVLMRSSPFGLIGHGHPGNNAFVISYNGKSAFDGTGTYSSSGDYFSLQNYKHTRAKNSILPCGNVCEGLDSSGYGWMPRFLVGDKISYCLGDASQAFSGKFTRHEGNLKGAGLTLTAKDGFIKPGVTRWRRHLALLENGTVIVYDELEAEKPITWTYMLNNHNQLEKLADDRVLSGSNAVAVAQLFTTEALSTTVTDQWYGEDKDLLKKKLGWKTGMRHQNFPKNQWHAYMAVNHPVAKLRFLNVIRPVSVKDPAPCKEQVAANGRKQVVVDGWTIEAELDSDKPSFLKIYNEDGTAALVSGQAARELQLGETVERPELSGTTVLMEKVAGERKPKVQKAVDVLPDVVRYGNIY